MAVHISSQHLARNAPPRMQLPWARHPEAFRRRWDCIVHRSRRLMELKIALKFRRKALQTERKQFRQMFRKPAVYSTGECQLQLGEICVTLRYQNELLGNRCLYTFKLRMTNDKPSITAISSNSRPRSNQRRRDSAEESHHYSSPSFLPTRTSREPIVHLK